MEYQLRARFCLLFGLYVLCGIFKNIKADNWTTLNKCATFISSLEANHIRIPSHLVSIRERNNESELTFRLTEARSTFSCNNEIRTIRIPLSKVKITDLDKIVDMESGKQNYSIEVGLTAMNVPRFLFSSLGVISTDQEYFTPQEYCVNEFNDYSIEVHLCKNGCTKSNPCVKKCCEPGYSVSISTSSCEASGIVQWSPEIFDDPYTKFSAKLRPHYILFNTECPSDSGGGSEADFNIWPLRNVPTSDNHTHEKVLWRLLGDGSILYLGASRKWTKLNSENYCIDGMQDFGEDEFFSGSSEDQVLLLCAEEIKQKNISVLYVIMLFVASFFLLLTAAAYILLFDKQTIHGWTVLCFCCSMFLMYTLLATAHMLGMFRTFEEESGSPLCVTVGVLAHFFFLSTFCWLTLINFDICWTFRSLTPATGRSKGLKRFLCYLAFAWTIPLTVVITGLILDHKFPNPESEVIVPEYGQKNCFLASSARGIYLYYIVGALLSCNFILIAMTVLTIYRWSQNSKILFSGRSPNHHQSIKLFAKLFVIMGFTWIFEIISWSLSNVGDIEWGWVALDMINLLQAIAIFVIFVCKKTTLSQIYARVPILEKFLSPGCLSNSNSSKLKKFNLTQIEHKTSPTSFNASTKISLSQKSDPKF